MAQFWFGPSVRKSLHGGHCGTRELLTLGGNGHIGNEWLLRVERLPALL